MTWPDIPRTVMIPTRPPPAAPHVVTAPHDAAQPATTKPVPPQPSYFPAYFSTRCMIKYAQTVIPFMEIKEIYKTELCTATIEIESGTGIEGFGD